MILKKLLLRNFMSHKETELTFKGTGLYLINGPTAAGKSTIMEAIHWCLYGGTLRVSNVNSVLSDFSNNKDCYVAVGIDDDGVGILIERLKTGTTSGSTTVTITIDGVSEEYNRVTDANARIVQVLGIDERLFKSTVVFGQGLNKFFADSRIVDEKERKKILETAMRLEAYDTYKEVAVKKVGEFSGKLLSIDITKAALEETIKGYRDTINKFVESSKLNKSELIADLNNIIHETERSLEDTYLNILNTNRELENIGNRISELNILQSRQTDEIIRIGYRSREAKLKRDEISEASSSLDYKQECPLCLRSISTSEAGDIHVIYFNNLKKADADVAAATEDLVPIVKEKKKTSDDLVVEMRNKESLLGLLETYNSKRIREICAIESAKKEIAYAQEMPKNELDTISIMTEKIHEAEREIAIMENKIDAYNKLRDAYEFWKEAFSDTGMKNMLFNNVMPMFNVIVNKYLNTFSNGHMSFNMGTTSITKGGEFKDKLSIAITVDGFVKSYENCSGGEERMVDIADMLTLRDIALTASKKSLNMVVADEIFDWLDGASIERVMGVMEDMAKDNLVLIITHNKGIKDYFYQENIINIAKTEDGSCIIRGDAW